MPVYRCSFQDARGIVLRTETIECADNAAAIAEAALLVASVPGCRSVSIHDGVRVIGLFATNPGS